jgi:hypothetical protein
MAFRVLRGRFPGCSQAHISAALRDANGHAGRAGRALRQLMRAGEEIVGDRHSSLAQCAAHCGWADEDGDAELGGSIGLGELMYPRRSSLAATQQMLIGEVCCGIASMCGVSRPHPC